jgi:HEAT repeat protein
MGPALLLALVLGFVQTAAQEPAGPPTLAMVRERVQAGELDVAWSLIQKVPESSEALREGTTLALARNDLEHAVEWYSRFIRRQPAGDDHVLTALVNTVGARLKDEQDPDVHIPTCLGLARLGNRECLAQLNQLASSSAVPPAVRLEAATAAVDAGLHDAQKLLRQAADDSFSRNPVATAGVLVRVDAAKAVPALIGLLTGKVRDAQYLAAYALGHFNTPEAKHALQNFIGSPDAVDGRRIAAQIALSRLGDNDALAHVVRMLPNLGGRDLLEAADALDANRNPRAVDILRQVLSGDHQQLRYEAAVRIATRDREAARRTLLAGLSSDNPWARIASLNAFRRLNWRLPEQGTVLLADRLPQVAAAAVAAAARTLPSRPAALPNGL